MEGDLTFLCFCLFQKHFNPLPPHGGRLIYQFMLEICFTFQSTPSAWRETTAPVELPQCGNHFNPLPPHGGRREITLIILVYCCISIHSLRMEGDVENLASAFTDLTFQSTPSAWRETAKLHRKAFFISPILVQSCKKGCKRLHSAPEKMVFFEKREKNLVRNLQHLSVRL